MNEHTKDVFNKFLTNGQLARYFLDAHYTVWHGVAECDTRPFVEGTKKVPLSVSYYEGDACNHIPDVGDVEAGDVKGFLESLPIGSVVVEPDYSGSNWEGELHFVKTNRGWWLDRYIQLYHGEVVITKYRPPKPKNRRTHGETALAAAFKAVLKQHAA